MSHRGVTWLHVTASDGFDVWGLHVRRMKRWPRRKSQGTLKDTIRAKTKRTRAQNLSRIIAEVHPTHAGWFGDFQHSRPWIIHRPDAWIGGRLRSLLRDRTKLRGRGRDHHRGPDAGLVEHGLFSLANAHRSPCPSSRR